jgi:hypothetical protein
LIGAQIWVFSSSNAEDLIRHIVEFCTKFPKVFYGKKGQIILLKFHHFEFFFFFCPKPSFSCYLLYYIKIRYINNKKMFYFSNKKLKAR